MVEACFRKPKADESVAEMSTSQMLKIIRSKYTSLVIDHSARVHLGYAMRDLGYDCKEHHHARHYYAVPLSKTAWRGEVLGKCWGSLAQTPPLSQPLSTSAFQTIGGKCCIFLSFLFFCNYSAKNSCTRLLISCSQRCISCTLTLLSCIWNRVSCIFQTSEAISTWLALFCVSFVKISIQMIQLSILFLIFASGVGDIYWPALLARDKDWNK